MLKKLLKHEWKSVSKVLLPVNLGIILITAIGCIVLNTNIFATKESFPIALFMLIFYVLSLMTFASITLIYVYVRFYKNLFSAEGYLMHTLPVAPIQLFHSKLIVGFAWSAFNCLLTLFSTAALGYSAIVRVAKEENIDSIYRFFLGDSISNNHNQTFSFAEMFGFPPATFVILLLLMLLTGCLVSILMGYLSILLGQLMEKFKLAASIGFYIAIYLIMQMVTSIAILLPNSNLLVNTMDNDSASYFMNVFYKNLFPASIISQLILSIIFYLASYFLIRRKVNLD